MNKMIYINKLLVFFFTFFLLLSSAATSIATDAVYVWSNNSDILPTSSNISESLSLESYSYVLIDQNTQTILAANNEHVALHPASVTKIMSILLIMEAISDGSITLLDQVPCSENAASMGGSQIWLDTRESLSVDDMLKAICVASANDCVVAMAEYIAGSESAFVQMMNDKAKQLRYE